MLLLEVAVEKEGLLNFFTNPNQPGKTVLQALHAQIIVKTAPFFHALEPRERRTVK